MAIASITAWLADKKPNYNHGRSLYEQYGDDRLVLTIIQSGSGSYHFSKLKDALEFVNTKPNLVPKQIVFKEPAPIEQPATAGTLLKTNLDQAPPEVRKIRDDKNKLYAEARHLHQAVKSVDSDEHRLELALTILDNMDAVNERWVALDNWKATGEIMEVAHNKTLAEVAQLSTADLLKEQKNLPPNISKARTNVKKTDDPVKKAKYQLKVTHLIARLKEVQRRVDELV